MSHAANEVYARRLLPKRLGYPLWYPEPSSALPSSYRERGVSIGDLGLVTSMGSFDFLFNICLPAGHPINEGRTPQHFEVVDVVESRDVNIFPDAHSEQSYVACSSIKKRVVGGTLATQSNTIVPVDAGIELQFTSTRSEGALLVLPKGGDRRDLVNLRKFRNHVLRFGMSWYEHVNVELGREASNGSLYLVTGCDKSSCWGTASFSDASEEVGISFSLAPAVLVEGSLRSGYSWQTSSPVAGRVGPGRNGRDVSQTQNQCVFIRGFSISVREGLLRKVLPSVVLTSVADIKPGKISGKGASIPFLRASQMSSSQRLGNTSGGSGQISDTASDNCGEDMSDNDIEIDHFPAVLEPFHPAKVINEWLLTTVPDAIVAVTHDSDWFNILEEDTELPNNVELLSRISTTYTARLHSEPKDGAFLELRSPAEATKSGVSTSDTSSQVLLTVSESGKHDKDTYNADLGKIISKPFKGHTGGVNCVAFSPDGKLIVSGSEDKMIQVWEAESGKVILGPMKDHTGSVTSVAFSPDGKHIVSGSWDKTVQVWDAKSGKVISRPFEGHTDRVTSVAFSSDGKLIVSGSQDRTVRVWDAESGKVISGPFEGHTGVVESVAFSPDGKHIASGSWDKTVRVWNAKSGKVISRPFEGHTSWINSVAFSPDSKLVVSGSWDRTVWVWNVESGKVFSGPLKGHTDGVTSVAFSPDGRHIASGSWDTTVRVWDAKSGRGISGPFEGHTYRVTSVVFSPDGKLIVSGSWDKTVQVWDVESGKAVSALDEAIPESDEAIPKSDEGHTKRVKSATFWQFLARRLKP